MTSAKLPVETPIRTGNLVGSIFDFQDAGDQLPLHSHGPDDVHISVVARGLFRIFGDGWELEAAAGRVLDWQVGQAHGYEALVGGSRLVNVIKGTP